MPSSTYMNPSNPASDLPSSPRSPATPRFLSSHSRKSSSLDYALLSRSNAPFSPYAPYSPFSPASEHDAFLTPTSPGARTPTSPVFSPSLQSTSSTGPSGYFYHHVALPPASKRRVASKILIIALPALIGLTLLAGVATYSDIVQAELVSQTQEKLHASVEAIQSSLSTVKEWIPASIVTSGSAKPAAVNGSIEISVLPRMRTPKIEDADDKYLGYLPHSGYHNQRIELVQAMILAKMLNRTLLVPPVWIGWPSGWSYYDVLQRVWNEAMQTTERSFALPPRPAEERTALYEPGNFFSTRITAPLNGSVYDDPQRMENMEAAIAERKAYWESLGYTEFRPDGYPITNLTAADCKSYTPECRHTYKDTFLSWDSLVNLDKAASMVKLIDRWDIRERAVQELLNVTADEIFVFQDEVRYDFQFDARVKPGYPLINKNTNSATRWARTVSIDAMRNMDHKVLLVGTLFGSGRIRGTGFDYFKDDLPKFLRRSMAFNNPWIINPANQIRGHLGGSDGYAGVHARVGDGVFARDAQSNMEVLWRDLVRKIGIPQATADTMWDKVKPIEDHQYEANDSIRKRGLFDEEALEEMTGWSFLDVEGEFEVQYEEEEDSNVDQHSKRSLFDKQPSQRKARRAAGLVNASHCRGLLYDEPELELFNTRIYLATDSRSPLTDPNLKIFFDSFPCTFILSDFEKDVPSVGEMSRLVNAADGVSLGRLFMPFLEASIAAKGFVTAGTPGSTFSIFAQGSLHDAFHEDGDEAPTDIEIEIEETSQEDDPVEPDEPDVLPQAQSDLGTAHDDVVVEDDLGPGHGNVEAGRWLRKRARRAH